MYGGFSYGSRAYGSSALFGIDLQKVLTESMSFADSLLKDDQIRPSDVIAMSSLFNRTVNNNRALSEVLWAQGYLTTFDYTRIHDGNHVIAINDLIKLSTFKNISDVFALIASVLVSTPHFAISDNFTIVEDMTKQSEKSFIDSFVFTENEIKEITKILTDSISFISLISETFGITKTEALSFIDSFSSISSFSLSATETFSIVEQFFKKQTKTAAELLALTESINKEQLIPLVDSSTLVDSVKTTSNKKFTDVAALEVISPIISSQIIKTDSTSLVDRPLQETTTLSPNIMSDDDSIGTVVWSNPDNAKTSNNVYATTPSITFGFHSDYEVKIVKSDSAIGTENKKLATPWTETEGYFSYGGSANLWSESWSAEDINNSNFGVVLSVIQNGVISHYLKATDFGFTILNGTTINGILVEIERFDNNNFPVFDASVDHIRITVYYTTAEGEFRKEIGLVKVGSVILADFFKKQTDISKQDSLILAEIFARTVETKKILTDTMVVLESLAKETGTDISITELLNMLETSAFDISTVLSDIISLSAILSKKEQELRTSDSFNITELLSFKSDIIFTDSLSFIESLSKTAGLSIVDSLNITEALERISVFKKDLSDIVLIAEIIVKNTGVSISDAFSISEQFLSSADKKITDSVAFADALEKQIGFTIDDSFIIAETLARAIPSFSITNTLSFIVSTTKETTMTLTEILNMIENNILTSGTTFNEIIQATESFMKTIGKDNIETLNVLETLIKEYISRRQETLSLSELRTFATRLNNIASLTILDKLSIETGLKKQEIITLQKTFSKALDLKTSDSITFSADLLKSINMPFSEILNIVENFSSLLDIRNDFIEQIDLSVSLKLNEEIIKSIINVLNVLDNIKFDVDKRKNAAFIITDQVIPGFGTTRSDIISIEDKFSKSVFIGIIDIEGIAETLVKDYGMSVADSFTISETIKERGEVEPLARKTYLFTKGNKSYLFHNMQR